jgi:hypothetical protein
MAKLLVLVFVLPVLAASVSDADVSGTWGLTFKADWTSIPDLVCKLSQKGEKLTGPQPMFHETTRMQIHPRASRS